MANHLFDNLTNVVNADMNKEYSGNWSLSISMVYSTLIERGDTITADGQDFRVTEAVKNRSFEETYLNIEAKHVIFDLEGIKVIGAKEGTDEVSYTKRDTLSNHLDYLFTFDESNEYGYSIDASFDTSIKRVVAINDGNIFDNLKSILERFNARFEPNNKNVVIYPHTYSISTAYKCEYTSNNINMDRNENYNDMFTKLFAEAVIVGPPEEPFEEYKYYYETGSGYPEAHIDFGEAETELELENMANEYLGIYSDPPPRYSVDVAELQNLDANHPAYQDWVFDIAQEVQVLDTELDINEDMVVKSYTYSLLDNTEEATTSTLELGSLGIEALPPKLEFLRIDRTNLAEMILDWLHDEFFGGDPSDLDENLKHLAKKVEIHGNDRLTLDGACDVLEAIADEEIIRPQIPDHYPDDYKLYKPIEKIAKYRIQSFDTLEKYLKRYIDTLATGNINVNTAYDTIYGMGAEHTETIEVVFDVWIDLAYVNVEDAEIDDYEEGVDYHINEEEGQISFDSTGGMTEGEEYDVTYTYGASGTVESIPQPTAEEVWEEGEITETEGYQLANDIIDYAYTQCGNPTDIYTEIGGGRDGFIGGINSLHERFINWSDREANRFTRAIMRFLRGKILGGDVDNLDDDLIGITARTELTPRRPSFYEPTVEDPVWPETDTNPEIPNDYIVLDEVITSLNDLIADNETEYTGDYHIYNPSPKIDAYRYIMPSTVVDYIKEYINTLIGGVVDSGEYDQAGKPGESEGWETYWDIDEMGETTIEWAEGQLYQVNDEVIIDDVVYVCIQDHYSYIKVIEEINNTFMNYYEEFSTTLFADIDDQETEIKVDDAEDAPYPPFVVEIGDEKMRVTEITIFSVQDYDQLIVSRGAEETTAAAHTAGAVIERVEPYVDSVPLENPDEALEGDVPDEYMSFANELFDYIEAEIGNPTKIYMNIGGGRNGIIAAINKLYQKIIDIDPHAFNHLEDWFWGWLDDQANIELMKMIIEYLNKEIFGGTPNDVNSDLLKYAQRENISYPVGFLAAGGEYHKPLDNIANALQAYPTAEDPTVYSEEWRVFDPEGFLDEELVGSFNLVDLERVVEHYIDTIVSADSFNDEIPPIINAAYQEYTGEAGTQDIKVIETPPDHFKDRWSGLRLLKAEELIDYALDQLGNPTEIYMEIGGGRSGVIPAINELFNEMKSVSLEYEETDIGGAGTGDWDTKRQMPRLFVSPSDPDDTKGTDGDIWFRHEEGETE